MAWEAGHVVANDALAIPKGAPNKELAELLIAWTSFQEINARIAQYITYGPINTKSIELIPELTDADTVASLPASHFGTAVIEDQVWLGKNSDRLNQRYLAIFQK